MIVKATREGLVGDETASGYHIDTVVAFVALPARAALGRFVRVTNPATRKTTLAQVLDVGPHLTHDDAYVFGTARPYAETGHKQDGTPMNGAGIDLSEAVWEALGMVDNGPVDWEFV